MSEHVGELGAGLGREFGVSADDCRWNGAGEASGPCTQLVFVWPLAPPLGWPWHPGQVTESALDFGFAICQMGQLPSSQDCYEAYVDGMYRACQVGTW